MPIYLANVRGFDLNYVANRPLTLWLPPYISRVEPRGVGVGTRRPVIAVALKDVISERGKSAIKARSLRRRLGVSDKTQILLMCCGDDSLLEYADANFIRLTTEFASCGFSAVSGIGFSVYYSDPPLESHINIKRCLHSYATLERAEVRAFPMIAWRYRSDIERWAEWLRSNPLIHLVGLDFQDCKTQRDWQTITDGFRELVNLCSPEVRFLVYGVAAKWKIKSLAQITTRLHIINEQPFMKATKGVASPDTIQASLWSSSTQDLFQAWLAYYDKLCLELIGFQPNLRRDMQPVAI